jgi:uncharacterized membrane protein YccC
LGEASVDLLVDFVLVFNEPLIVEVKPFERLTEDIVGIARRAGTQCFGDQIFVFGTQGQRHASSILKLDMPFDGLKKLLVTRENPATVVHAARTTVAVVASYCAATLLDSREGYWAPISTMVVMQSNLGASLPISVQRFAGTAVGALVGAITYTYFGGSIWAFGAAVLAMGIGAALLKAERGAYRFAGITAAIVMLVPHTADAWTVASHRFLEVSLGIAVGLVMSAVWPEKTSR